MAYAAKQGRRPPEYASKSSHGYIVVDPTVEALLKNCHFPKSAQEVTLTDYENVKVNDGQDNPIENIIAVDGSFSEVRVPIVYSYFLPVWDSFFPTNGP